MTRCLAARSIADAAADTASGVGSSRALRNALRKRARVGLLISARFLSRRKALLADDVTGISKKKLTPHALYINEKRKMDNEQ